jgi:hypothetical protein
VTELAAFEEVRVRELRRPPEAYDGWMLNQRPPAVGDVGTLIDVLSAPGAPSRYLVEMSGADGVTIWLGEFDAEELAPAR